MTTPPPTQELSRRRLHSAGLLAWIHMLRIVRRTERGAAQHLKQWDLSHAQFDILAQVGASEGISQQDLARKLLVTQGNITQLIDRLEQRGLVRRCPEGRTNILRLTDTGRQLFTEVVPAHERWQDARLDGLEPDERRQLMRLLAKLDRSQR